MTKQEYAVICERTQAMDKSEVNAILDNVPDGMLMRQMLRRYSYLMDFKTEIERAIIKVNKAYEVQIDGKDDE